MTIKEIYYYNNCHLSIQLLIKSIINNNFKCIVIGSTNIAEDCSDLMRIFESDIWLQFDKNFKLKQILSLNTNNINDNYIIKYHPINLYNIFSPYYTQNISNNSSYDQILNLCNQSVHIHQYLHHITMKSSISYFSYCFIYLLLQYFKCMKIVYELCYAIIVFIPPLFILSDCRIIHEITLNNKKNG